MARSTELLRVGLVGLGPRGDDWISALRLVGRAKLVAVCDRDARLLAAGAASAKLGEGAAFRELDDMLAGSALDAVAVVVATEFQPDLIVRALEAGKHVICEVPLAYSLEDCWRLVLAVERSGLKLALAEQLSHAAFVHAWRKMVGEGQLGKPTYGEAQYIGSGYRYFAHPDTGELLTWEQGRSIPDAQKTRFWNIEHPAWYNPHSLAPLLRILDTRVASVTCMATRRPSYHREELPLPDLEVALMQTEADTILRIANGFVAPAARPSHWFHLLGTLGEVETGRQLTRPGAFADDGLMWLAEHEMPSRKPVTWASGDEDGAEGWRMHDRYPAEDFVASVLDDRPPVIDVYRAANIAAAGVLAGISAERGARPLEVPDFRPGPKRALGQDPPQSELGTAGEA